MKCLLLEDNADLREVIQSGIEVIGTTCLSAASVTEALLLMDRESDFTHLLTDWRIADGDAQPVVDLAFEKYPSINIAVYSGGLPPAAAVFPPQARFFQKPVSLKQLVAWFDNSQVDAH